MVAFQHIQFPIKHFIRELGDLTIKVFFFGRFVLVVAYLGTALGHVSLRWGTSHYVGARFITLRHVSLRWGTSHYVGARLITLGHVSLRWGMSHYVGACLITLGHVSLRWGTSHYIGARLITLLRSWHMKFNKSISFEGPTSLPQDTLLLQVTKFLKF